MFGLLFTLWIFKQGVVINPVSFKMIAPKKSNDVVISQSISLKVVALPIKKVTLSTSILRTLTFLTKQ